MALNCWEFMGCGREPGGRLAAERGVCPAALFAPADGYLGGRNGGRACCYVTGTFCEELAQGTYRDKSKDCWGCAFYRLLRREHGAAFSRPGFAQHLARSAPATFSAFMEENREGAPRPPAPPRRRRAPRRRRTARSW